MNLTTKAQFFLEVGWWIEVIAMLGGGVLLAVTGRNEPVAVQVLVACFVPVLVLLGGGGLMIRVQSTRAEFDTLEPFAWPAPDAPTQVPIIDVTCPRCSALTAVATYWECGPCNIGWHDCGMPDCDRRRRIDEPPELGTPETKP